MSEDQARAIMIRRLLGKSDAALEAARRELAAGDSGLASNRVYYACFYAASAALLREQLEFVKHSGVRASLHKHLVRAGKLSPELGRFYDKAFVERQEADYNALATFDPAVVRERIMEAERFVSAIKSLFGE